MTGAFAGILNGGSAVTPYGLTDLRLMGDDTPLMDASSVGIGERIIRQEAARPGNVENTGRGGAHVGARVRERFSQASESSGLRGILDEQSNCARR